MQKIDDCYYVTLYSEEKEEYISFLTPECSRMYEQYLQTRRNEGETLSPQSPLFRRDYNLDQAKDDQSIGIQAIYDITSRMVRKSGIEYLNAQKMCYKLDHLRTQIELFEY